MLRKNRLGLSFVTVTIAVTGFGGCYAPPEDAPGAPLPATEPGAGSAGPVALPSPSAEDTVYRTVVRFSPDGSPQPTVEPITRAEQQAELAARAAFVEASRLDPSGGEEYFQDLQKDYGCAGASLWLFDKTGLAGDELCLYRNSAVSWDWVDLGTFCRIRYEFTCVAHWDGAVRSLWAGADPGNLQTCGSNFCYSSPQYGRSFSAWERIDNTGTSYPFNRALLEVP